MKITSFMLKPLVFFMIFGLFSFPGLQADENSVQEYIRLVRNEKKVVTALETAVIHYESNDVSAKKANVTTVDLIGAIHIGDKAYYDKINELFGMYDVVLFELVISGEPKNIPSRNVMKESRKEKNDPLSMLQNGMANTLHLEHQLHIIDYKKKNMVHADMDAEQLYKRMIEDGELGNLLGRAFFAALGQGETSGKTQGRFLASLFAKDKSLAMKRAMAMEMADNVEKSLYIIDGDGSTLIAERNQIALERLKEQMKTGKKKIAIFYGAAHLYDFDERLREDFKMKPTKTDWVTAWDMFSAP